MNKQFVSEGLWFYRLRNSQCALARLGRELQLYRSYHQLTVVWYSGTYYRPSNAKRWSVTMARHIRELSGRTQCTAKWFWGLPVCDIVHRNNKYHLVTGDYDYANRTWKRPQIFKPLTSWKEELYHA